LSDGLRAPASPSAALAMGAVGAAIAALPAVRRVAECGVTPGVAWLALSGGTALVLGPLLACTRVVGRGSSTLRAALVGLALASAPLATLGKLIKLDTHHRPLGAATFAFLALGLVLAIVLMTVRVIAWTHAEPTLARRSVRQLVIIAAIGSLVLALLRAGTTAGFEPSVDDGARALIIAALAQRALDTPLVEGLARRAGVLSWVVLVVLGLVVGRGPVKVAVHKAAPVLGGPATWL
jgi:hypothetical protein